MFKQLARVQHTGGGEIHLLQRKSDDPLFRVRGLVLAITLTVKNSHATNSQQLLREAFFQNSKLTVFYRDGQPMVRGVPLWMMEGHTQHVRRGYPDTMVETADRTITAINGATEQVTFFIEVPFELPFAKDPRGFEQSLSLVGPIVLAIGGTGNADLSITQTDVTVVAVGSIESKFFSGIRQLITVTGSQAPLTSEGLALANRRLVNLLAYTTDVAGAPLAGTKPRATVDETNQILNAPDITVPDLLKFYGPRGSAAGFPGRSTLIQKWVAPIIMAADNWRMGKLPQGNTLKLEYDSNAAAQGKQFYLMHQLQPKDDAVRASYPGAAREGGLDNVRAATEVDKLSSGDVVPPEVRDWLPEKIYTVEARRNGACGC